MPNVPLLAVIPLPCTNLLETISRRKRVSYSLNIQHTDEPWQLIQKQMVAHHPLQNQW